MSHVVIIFKQHFDLVIIDDCRPDDMFFVFHSKMATSEPNECLRIVLKAMLLIAR